METHTKKCTGVLPAFYGASKCMGECKANPKLKDDPPQGLSLARVELLASVKARDIVFSLAEVQALAQEVLAHRAMIDPAPQSNVLTRSGKV